MLNSQFQARHFEHWRAPEQQVEPKLAICELRQIILGWIVSVMMPPKFSN